MSSFSDWAIGALAPTAASVTVSGRVTSAKGRGVSKAFVTMTLPTGETRYAVTNPFGFYRFTDVVAGATYIFNVRHKCFEFAPQVLTVFEGLEDLNFAAKP